MKLVVGRVKQNPVCLVPEQRPKRRGQPNEFVIVERRLAGEWAEVYPTPETVTLVQMLTRYPLAGHRYGHHQSPLMVPVEELKALATTGYTPDSRFEEAARRRAQLISERPEAEKHMDFQERFFPRSIFDKPDKPAA